MKNFIISNLLLVAVTVFSSCEEIVDPPEPTEENTSVAITAISPEASYVKTALDIQADASFDTLTNYSISVGGEPVEVVATNGTTVTVQVPLELAPGEHAVEITYQGESRSSANPLNVLDHRDLTSDGLAIVATQNAEYPIIATNEDREFLIPIIDQSSGGLTGAVYFNDTIQNVVSYNDEGLPATLNSANYIVVFENYTETGVDIAIISPEDEISVFRNLEYDDWANQRRTNINARMSESDIAIALEGASLGLSIMGCAIAGPLALTGAPPAVIAGVVSCSSALLSVANRITESQSIELEGSALAFGIFSDHLGCAQVMNPPYVDGVASCANILLTLASEIIDATDEVQNSNTESIELARQSLLYGGGDVQITLTWNTTADLDLHVIDPNGERIAYFSPASSSGGMLDVDDVDGFGPENIFWQQQQSPEGTYQVEVNHFAGESPSSFTVLVQALGQTRQYTGTISGGEFISIVTFMLGETLPEGRFEPANLNARLLVPKK